jgi:hypothetical protein
VACWKIRANSCRLLHPYRNFLHTGNAREDSPPPATLGCALNYLSQIGGGHTRSGSRTKFLKVHHNFRATAGFKQARARSLPPTDITPPAHTTPTKDVRRWGVKRSANGTGDAIRSPSCRFALRRACLGMGTPFSCNQGFKVSTLQHFKVQRYKVKAWPNSNHPSKFGGPSGIVFTLKP